MLRIQRDAAVTLGLYTHGTSLYKAQATLPVRTQLFQSLVVAIHQAVFRFYEAVDHAVYAITLP